MLFVQNYGDIVSCIFASELCTVYSLCEIDRNLNNCGTIISCGIHGDILCSAYANDTGIIYSLFGILGDKFCCMHTNDTTSV